PNRRPSLATYRPAVTFRALLPAREAQPEFARDASRRELLCPGGLHAIQHQDQWVACCQSGCRLAILPPLRTVPPLNAADAPALSLRRQERLRGCGRLHR